MPSGPNFCSWKGAWLFFSISKPGPQISQLPSTHVPSSTRLYGTEINSKSRKISFVSNISQAGDNPV